MRSLNLGRTIHSSRFSGLCLGLFLLITLVPRSAAQAVPSPPQGTQTDAVFAGSFKSHQVTNVFATTQRTSCYTPEVSYSRATISNR